ncbi:cell death abnormality protein 1-like [Ruditapes philippinarum]|uniref:cell death abnormality protein 1-like n=1 Tax=Ruditapes philippinarum TaxID=129788 RepID=UPI00295C3389|nr:cell death abnormality protein 1-like [Ruditapes philippinarum]
MMLSKETSAFILVLFVDMVFTECSVGCQSSSGSTCTICESSYYLLNGFCSPCPENCESCNSYDDCTSCKPNKYGFHARCSFNCDGNFLNSECDDDTGYCTECKPGIYGYQCQFNCSFCVDERCDLRTCSNGCKAVQQYVKHVLQTVNIVRIGKHVILAMMVLVFMRLMTTFTVCHAFKTRNVRTVLFKVVTSVKYTMIRYYDDCTLCKPNNYGLHARCAFNCDGNCLNSECQDDTGLCTQCKPGFYGVQCQHNCSLCDNERCDLRFCSSGCRAGYYDLACNPACIVKSGKRTCEHTDGYCLNGCNQTFWGDTCEQHCPGGCKDLKCDRNNGACTNGCKDGLTGDKCTQTIAIETSVTTTTTTSAESVTQQQSCARCEDKVNNFAIIYFSGFGSCVAIEVFAVLFYLIRRRYVGGKTPKDNKPNVEIPTYYNTRTDFEAVNAESTDATKNYESLSNDRTTDNVYNDLGTALSSTLACNPACIVTSGKHTCEHAGGYCLNGCNQTFWGDTCDKSCPGGCKDLRCDRNTGTCTDGCKDGLTGDNCTQTTTIETSETTTQSAEPVTQQQTCARCDNKDSNFTIGYFSGFGSCAAIVVFAVLFNHIRRRYLASKTPQDNKHNVEIPTYYNTRTDFGAVNAESADVTNNYESLSNNRTTDNLYNDLGTTLS